MSRAAQAVAAAVAERKVKPREMRSRRMNDEDVRIEPTEQEQAEAPTTGAEPETTAAGAGDTMAKRKSKKTATKKASKLRAKKAAKARAPRAAAAKTARGARVAADSVFAFVKRPDDPTTLPARGLAILNAIEKLGSGTAEQVAKRVVKSDYDGKQELVYLSGFFLRKMLNLGLVSVERSA